MSWRSSFSFTPPGLHARVPIVAHRQRPRLWTWSVAGWSCYATADSPRTHRGVPGCGPPTGMARSRCPTATGHQLQGVDRPSRRDAFTTDAHRRSDVGGNVLSPLARVPLRLQHDRG